MPVTDMGQRFEFLSQAWIDEARQFVSARGCAADFSLCERFADPPPGIDGSWWLRARDGVVEAGPGVLEGADVQVDGDYQAILALAQTVYAAGEDAVARARRELIHRAGTSAFRVAGQVPPAVAPVLGELHDHLAARTIENPNLEHRLNRLGLRRQAEELAELGYTVIERAISEAFADEVRGHVQREVLAHDPFTTNGLIRRHRVFEEIAAHPWVCAVGQSALSQAMILGAMSGTYKEAGPGKIPLHVDSPFVHEPFPEWPHVVTACWALEDWTEAAGPTWVIPRSHLQRRRPRKGDGIDGAVPIEMPKGSVALWRDDVWHWQGDRTAPGARVAIHASYNRVFVRQLEDMRLPQEQLKRNGPAFQALMGMDDPFGRSSFTGHDPQRMANAGRQAFR
ncbi:phytanoyl-CoA dioxygenase family protein [uncultured Phenylobacterium sp.]|uniref:phytanoyl-CoA dioxygenase family protein n=1 Tax=uncultured Phenylobacterium sp. TaxID=349273 RepID=UPI0025F59196|nr:phytanoyl-CoA dioxygenase family protein [uncultured Phenylobacterium sp.]